MRSSRQRSAALARLRLVAIYLMLAVLLVFSRPTPMSVTAGFVFLLVGEAVRVWAAGHLVKNVELVVAGPYRFTRNPLYLGRLLIFSGLCVMARMPYGINLGLLALGWVVFFSYYLPRKERIESARLQGLHGEAYDRYREAVPALFPTRSPIPETTSTGWSSRRLIRNREHWMVLAMAIVWLLMLWIAHASPRGLLGEWLNGW